MSGYRLPDGGLVDRTKPVSVTFDGRTISGFQGDTLASALIAGGDLLVGRSFKYHRPRGILGIAAEEPNALVTLRSGARREPNIQATMAEISVGLDATSQNNWPSLRNDVMALNGLAAPFLVSGFYYKTLMGPTRRSWMLFEPWIRRAAGLGIAASQPDPDVYDKRNHFCDVLVVGAGPAGLAAALSAARSGARVTIADERADFGGSLRGAARPINRQSAHQWIAATREELSGLRACLLPRTTVFGYYDHQVLGAVERVADHLPAGSGDTPRQRLWTIRARQVVLATGSTERPIVFPDNDRPGVMLADAVRQYAEIYSVACGRSICIFTNNDSGYGTARALHGRGVAVRAIIDARSDIPEPCRAIVGDIGCQHFAQSVVNGVGGRLGVRAVHVATAGAAAGHTRVDCDCLAVSGGFTPTVALASQMGSAPVYDDRIGAFVPGTPAPTADWICAGAARGVLGTGPCLRDGALAGTQAAGNCGFDAMAAEFEVEDDDLTADAPHPTGAISGRGKAFVDFQNDVCASDVKLAVREGYRSVEHLKRYTTLGMATDQGRTANVNAIALVAGLEGVAPADVGTTRFRAPYAPVALGAIAGRHTGAHFQPLRRTPMHDWHAENGGVLSPVGAWMRPLAYPATGETVRQAYIREASNVRQAVGICDVSTLGKIDVQGPDAAEFLNRVYSNPFLKVPVGKARYGLMLRDDGMVLDDGTSWRLTETHFLMTTTTGGAGTVMAHLERLLNIFWPELRVSVVSVTSQWAGMSVAGPHARDLLQTAAEAGDLSDDAVPFMGLLHSTIGGVPVLIARLSFSGELAYEVFCGSDHGLHVWTTLIDAGAAFGLMPYGTEALGTLRIEKGHIAGGEMDGRISPFNVALGAMVSKKKDFFGSKLVDRDGLHDPQRYELVGVVARDGRPLTAGSHVVAGDKDNAGPSQGFISSTTNSPALNKEIALALVKNGSARIGDRMFAANPVRGQHREIDIVSPHFYDPDGSRMRG